MKINTKKIIHKLSKKSMKYPCEYNPLKKRAAYEKEVHAQAAWVVGANGQWRLCESCAKLPEFKRYQTYKSIIIFKPRRYGDATAKALHALLHASPDSNRPDGEGQATIHGGQPDKDTKGTDPATG